MSNNQIKILGINVSNLNFREVLESIEKYLANDQLSMTNDQLKTIKPLVIFTPNPEIVVYAQKDEKFKEIVNTAQIKIPDGVGLIWAGRILRQPLKERISGVDLMKKLVELSARKGLVVGLIGGGKGVAVKALECLREKYPGLKGWAEEGPVVPKATPLPQIPIEIGRWVSARGGLVKPCSFLFVGLGCPKQEYFIANLQLSISNFQLSRPLVLMAVGGSFDYLSGKVPRAPFFIRSIGFEWVWRLLLQPWRLKRQLSLVKFAWLILKQKLA